MQAMYGARRVSARQMCRLLGCVVGLVALAAIAMPSVAAAKPPTVRSTYVALGDSLAFGYSQQLFNENAPFESPTGFEQGYANDYLGLVNAKMGKKQAQLVNDGCPGETTESLIGDNPTLLANINTEVKGKVAEPVTGEAPCEYHYTNRGSEEHPFFLPLHHEYGGSKSQLESAIQTIETERAAGTPVKMISLDIGANDELHVVAKAEHEATLQVEGKVAAIVTPEAEAQVKAKAGAAIAKLVEEALIAKVAGQAFVESGGVEPAFAEDIAKDIGEFIANHPEEFEDLKIVTAAKYLAEHGKELKEEGEKIGAELGAKYFAAHGLELLLEGEKITLAIVKADSPAMFEQIDTNVIGILTALHRMAAYHGKVIFEGTYDAYGRVRGVTKFATKLVPGENHQTELFEGFNQGAAELATFEKATLTHAAVKLKVCYSNAETLFNPASVSNTLANEEAEEQDMAEWTNMANFTTFKGKANGPDIHATPLGYQKMAEQMNSTCTF
jgi:hypothetical protein